MLLGGLIAVNGCSSDTPHGPPEAGGISDHSTNAPKTIASTELTSCDLDYLLAYQEIPMGEGKRNYPPGSYSFHIAAKEGGAECTMTYRGRYDAGSRSEASFTADISAMSSLEQVIRGADIAQNNGHDKTNTALGTHIVFRADYASGEKISIYADGGASTIPAHFSVKPLLDWFTALAEEHGQEWLRRIGEYGETTDEFLPVGERAAAAYVLQDPDPEEGVIDAADVYYVGGRLLCEVSTLYEGSLQSYYALEIIPDEPGRFDVFARQDESVPVQVRWFSGFSNAGEYWDQPSAYALEVTEKQLVLLPRDGGEVVILDRDETYPAAHDAAAMQARLREEYGASGDLSAFATAWETSDGTGDYYLLLRSDGSMVFQHKAKDRPIKLYIGACTLTEDGTVHCLLERFGWGKQPTATALTLARTGHNELVLTETEPGHPLLGQEEIFLTPGTECCFGRLLP